MEPARGRFERRPGRFPIPKSLTSPPARRDGLGTQASNLRFGNFDFDRKKCVVAFSFPAPRRARARHTSRRPPPRRTRPGAMWTSTAIMLRRPRFPRAAEWARPARSRASRAPAARTPTVAIATRWSADATRRDARASSAPRAPTRRRRLRDARVFARSARLAPRSGRLLGGERRRRPAPSTRATPPGPPTETSQPLARLRGRDRAGVRARAPGRSPGRRSDRPSAVASATSSPRNRPR